RLISATGVALVMSGCGIWADTISDELTFDFEADVLEPEEVGDTFVSPVTFSVAVDQSSATYALPAGNTTPFSLVLVADQIAGTSQFSISADNFAFSSDGDDPVEFSVVVSSIDNRYLGQDLGYEPTQPASCTFELDPMTDGATEYGDSMTGCIRDFVMMNGAPLMLAYDVSTRSTADTRAPGDYTVAHTEIMRSEEELSFGVNRTFLSDIDTDVVENLDIAEFSSLSMQGFGFSTENVLLAGVVQVYDAFGNSAASGSLFTTINGGEIYSLFTRYENPPEGAESFTYAGNVTPSLVPASPDFEAAVLRAASTDVGKPDGALGATALAAWVVLGPAPRDGAIGITINGTGGPRTDGEETPAPTGDYIYTTDDGGFTTTPPEGN
ncbi:MAG: hypothetical protein AAFY60_00395, partial [Myxococcota bacterium]